MVLLSGVCWEYLWRRFLPPNVFGARPPMAPSAGGAGHPEPHLLWVFLGGSWCHHPRLCPVLHSPRAATWGHAGSEGFRGPCGGHGARHGQVRAWILHYHGLPAACQALCPLLSPRYNTWGFRFGLGGSKLVDFTSIQRDSGKSWPLKLFYFKDFIFTYLVSSLR